MTRSRRYTGSAAAALALAALLLSAAPRSPLAHDEGYYMLQARWIELSGHWLAPLWWGQPLYDRTIGNETRKMVGHFARNGFLYQFDRTNGQFVSAAQYVNQVTWTKGIDPKTGKPLEYNPALAVQTYLPQTRKIGRAHV